ncbi:MAG TPA: hypothetical protein VLJ57_21410 [Burkholderiaceae bacterium]|nr:hypothetical protein [Burkholderiaceae bacterium]
MMDEFVAGWLALPTWVQYFLAYIFLIFIMMLAQPMWRQRRVSERFAALAQALGATVTPGADKSIASFEIEREGRRFTLRRELRDAPRSNSTYRGPRGDLLFCETPLAGDNWKRHGVDIAEEAALPLMSMRPFKTGDAAFDNRFTAWQDGVPVRSGWLDSAPRGAVTAFFDTTPLSGALWVREGLLQYVGDAPKGMAPAALEDVLRAQCAVALAFERSAAHEGAF